MRRIGLILGIVLLAVATFAQDSKAPIVPDAVKVSIRDEQLQQARMAARYSAIQAEIKEIERAFPESAKRLNTAIEEAYKGVDKKVWVLNPDSLKFEPKPTPTP